MKRKSRTVPCLVIMTILAFSLGTGISIAGELNEVGISGWMDTDFLGNDKDGNKPYFDAHHLYLIWNHKLDQKFRVYVEVEIEHAPKTSSGQGDIKLERLYSEVIISPGFNIRAGKFNTPFGHWTPTHWAILVETVLKPIHENNQYVPPKSVGLEGFGRLFVGDNDIEWNAFVSNGSEYEATNKPQDRTLGAGADARFNFLDGDAFLGSSAYMQRNPSKNDRDETSYVAYGGFQHSGFDFKGELVSQKRGDGRGIAASVFDDVSTFYISGRYFLTPEIAPGIRLDSGDDDKSGAGEKHEATTFFVNWMPIPQALGKIELNLHKFDAASIENYNSWALYFGLIF